jgi:hypothetical protein
MTDITRNYHRGNPQSIAAAQNNQGNAARQRQRILAIAAQRGGQGITCDEAEHLLNLPHQSCSARFSELKRDGLLLPTLFTRQTRNGSNARVMFIAELVR